MSDKNIDKEILIEFTDGKKAKILDIKDINTEKIIQDLSKRLIDKNKELETWKKIAEILTANIYIPECKTCFKDKDCHKCIIDWARKEVTNDKQS